MPKTENVVAGRKSQAQILLEHVAADVCSANQLAKVMGVSKGRISHLTAQLLKKKKLTKQKRIFSSPKNQRVYSCSRTGSRQPSRSSKGRAG